MKAHWPWHRVALGGRVQLERSLGVRALQPSQPQGTSHSDAAGAYAREIAHARWSKMMRKRVANVLPSPSPLSPPPPGEAAHVAHLLDWFRTDLTGHGPGPTPLSYLGPGCSGSIVALLSDPLPVDPLFALVRLMNGRKGLLCRPLAPAHLTLPRAKRRSRGQPSDAEPETPRDEAILQRWLAAVNGTEACPLCPADPDRAWDPYHVLTGCTHPSVAAARGSALASLREVLLLVSRECLTAQLTHLEQLHSAARRLGTALDDASYWQSAEGRGCLFLLLLGIPWTQDAVTRARSAHDWPEGETAAELLGATFDLTRAPNHRLRRLPKVWQSWATRHSYAIALCWTSAFQRHSHNVTSAGPAPT
jgi:hypothetical protein